MSRAAPRTGEGAKGVACLATPSRLIIEAGCFRPLADVWTLSLGFDYHTLPPQVTGRRLA